MSRIYVSLGRAGDLINLLPVLKHECDSTGKPARLCVSRDFSGVIEGCSYIEPIIADVPFDQPGRAQAQLRGHYPQTTIIMSQAWGRDIPVTMDQNDFCREMWVKSFCNLQWGTLPPVFDRRNPEKERELYNSLVKTDRPLVVVNTSGSSAHWKDATGFADKLTAALPDFEVVDISSVRAGRIDALLGLFEKAHCLVTIDTATLHLAAAVPELPVVTLIPDRVDDWCVAPWRKNHIRRIRYSEVDKRFNEIVDCVKNPCKPIVFHSWCDWRGNPDARNLFARNTWKAAFAHVCYFDCEFKKEDSFRDSKSILGDTREMPFIRDMLDFAGNPNNRDVIVITNADIGLPDSTIGRVMEAVHRDGACYCHRWDQLTPFKRVPNRAMWKHLTFYDGCDLFAFTTKWWHDHRLEFPDMLLGCECWDGAMRHLIRIHGGNEVTKAIFHQRHDSFWQRPENFRKNVGNAYNCQLYSEFLKRTGKQWNDIKIQK